MSTVTTRLCQYGHQNCYQHMGQTQVIINNKTRTEAARQARTEAARARHQEMITKIEQMVTDGTHPRMVAVEFGSGSAESLERTLYRLGRKDLARYVAGARARKPGQARLRCAIKDCRGAAFWVEDPGLDPDDEPIAEWSYLCAVCQKFEDLCEDIEFLLDPKRGNEGSVFGICRRVGYKPTTEGLEALRQKLKRHGRLDLRDALDIESVKVQRGWHVQGTVRSDINNHWMRLVAADGVRAYERLADDPGRKLVGSLFR